MPEQQFITASFAAILNLPFGRFGIRLNGDLISEMVFLPPETPEQPPSSAAAKQISERIIRWIRAPQQPLELPLAARGTPFQRQIWQCLREIPSGDVRTYGELAHSLNSAPRAVGQACGANPFPLAIPCHRVVSAKGIGGFGNARDGYLIEAKRWLLNNEMQ